MLNALWPQNCNISSPYKQHGKPAPILHSLSWSLLLRGHSVPGQSVPLLLLLLLLVVVLPLQGPLIQSRECCGRALCNRACGCRQ